ncbi:MAG: hypothetical protein ACM3JH_08715 [Acidithiobacillales bacterium]
MNLTHLLMTYGVWIVALAAIAAIYLSSRRRGGNEAPTPSPTEPASGRRHHGCC